MTHGIVRGLEVDPFSIAYRDAVFLGARFGYDGNFGKVTSFFKTHGADARSKSLFAFYNWVADQADRAREAADVVAPDSLRKAVYDAVPDSPQKSKYGSFSQGRRPASLLLNRIIFNDGFYRGRRSVPSAVDAVFDSRTLYSFRREAHSRVPTSVRSSRVPVVSPRTIFAGSSRARV